MPACDERATYHKRYLQQTTQLVLILDAGLRVHETALVGDDGIAADKHVVGDCLSENLNLKHVRDDLLRFSVDVWVDERDVVVARDHIAECR